ncbi:MAG: DUF4271 domain-containing protein [Saprospiraceae bacterium]|nr:DUF4271 domain-containing protein [Saprospiraceae bacterium]
MKVLLRYTLVFLICLISLIVSGQNPFEVKGRVVASTQDSLARSTNEIVVPNADSIAATQSSLDARYDKLKENNPFEVSHIPLKRKTTPSIGQIPLDIKPKVSSNFIFWLMLFTLPLLALVLASKRDLLSKLTRSLFNENVLKLTKRQDGSGLSLHFVLMYIVFFINASVFIYLVLRHYYNLATVQIWFYVLVGVTSVYIVRHLTLRIFGWLFPLEKESALYSFTIMFINLLTGLLLIPINLLMAFGPESFFQPAFIVGLIIIGILLLIRYIRGFLISANFILSDIFLFFVYLCTLEIAPLLLGYRLIANL